MGCSFEAAKRQRDQYSHNCKSNKEHQQQSICHRISRDEDDEYDNDDDDADAVKSNEIYQVTKLVLPVRTIKNNDTNGLVKIEKGAAALTRRTGEESNFELEQSTFANNNAFSSSCRSDSNKLIDFKTEVTIETQRRPNNCHCQQLTTTLTTKKTKSQISGTTPYKKSNINNCCPKTTTNITRDKDSERAATTIATISTTRNKTELRPEGPFITADTTTIKTETTTTTTTTSATETLTNQQIKQNGNNSLDVSHKSVNQAHQQDQDQQPRQNQNQYQQPRPSKLQSSTPQSQPHQQRHQYQQRMPYQDANDACLHSYRNASMATRSMAATMAAACASSSCTVQEMFGHARNVLTTRLSDVSSKLIDNLSYYAEAAAVATTGRNAKFAQKRHSKQTRSASTKKSKHMINASIKQKHHKSAKSHHTRHNSRCEASQMLPAISAISKLSALSTSSSSLSSSIDCSNCEISAMPASTATVSASATVSMPSSSQQSLPLTLPLPLPLPLQLQLPLPSLSATTAAVAHASSTAAAAYNYIGHNYYHLLRNTISFYAASSVILVLCYLTTATSAAATNSDAAPLETHPIANIDWSKFDESSSDKEILDMLLEKKRYDKRLLPPVNDEDFCCGLSSPDMAIDQNTRRPHNRGTLTVNVNVLLLSLASPDESSLKYEVEFLLNQQWNDPRLQYGNKSHYDFLNALHHHDSIWTPDTYFIMHGDFKDPIIPMHFALRIYRNGTITYAMRRHLILSCQGSLHIFPFDDPKCSFSMESISYEVAQIKYVWKNDEDTLRKSPSLTTLNAYLIKNATTACEQTSWRGNYSCLRVDLIFTRDRAFYFTTVFIPGIILVTSSFITFWLEWNAVPARSMIGNYSCLQVALTFTRDRAYYFTTVFIPGIILVTSSFITFWLEWNAVPARVMIGVTTMLNFFTTSNGFRSTLPVVSNLTAMNVWDGVCMCFIYASLLEFVCVNYVGRKRPLHNVVYRPGENPVTQRLPAVLSRIGVILASPLEIIEREFQTALSSEKAAAGLSSSGATMPQTPTSATSNIHWERHYGGGMIGTAVKNLRARSMRRRCDKHHHGEHDGHTFSHGRQRPRSTDSEHIYAETTVSINGVGDNMTASAMPQVNATTMVTVEDDLSNEIYNVAAAAAASTATATRNQPENMQIQISGIENGGESILGRRKRSHSIATNTPPLILPGSLNIRVETSAAEISKQNQRRPSLLHLEGAAYPVKPPRKKPSRSTSPIGVIYAAAIPSPNSSSSFTAGACAHDHVRFANTSTSSQHGEKRRDAGAPNEIVACTTCGGSSSPCTHSANNGCATETCFVQVRKKEPPHPIRVAKTIDVIARITFPTAYAIFLIFFFVHYKGFS